MHTEEHLGATTVTQGHTIYESKYAHSLITEEETVIEFNFSNTSCALQSSAQGLMGYTLGTTTTRVM